MVQKVLEMAVKKELLYDGMYYDVTNWVKRHPGGKIIEIYVSTGEDSTLAVQQFHQRSTNKVMSIMNSLPQRRATGEELEIDSEKTQRHKALTKDFIELYQELQAEGMFKPDFFHVVLRHVEIIFMYFLGWYLYSLTTHFGFLWIVALSLSAFSIGRSAWVAHEAGHHSLTGNPKWDRFLEAVDYGMFFGVSGSYWTSQHSRHHAMPQHIKYDVDLATFPVLAFHAKVVKKPGQGKTFFIQNQKWLFLTCDTLLIGLFWKLYSHPKYCLHKGKYFDLFCMAMHYTMNCSLGFGVMAYLTGEFLSSAYLFGNFTLSHTHLPITEEPSHWVEYALCHTANIRSSWWVDYWMGNLNYQIEHHLFPTMPQFKNKLCRDRVKALAKKHNLPYNLYSYSKAVVKAFENLGAVSKELALEEVHIEIVPS